MFDKARAHRRKRGPLPKHDDIPLLDTSIATDFVQSVKKQWPGVREKIQPYVNKGKEKFGDVYASIATVLARQKEAFEDRRAEQKDRARSAKRQSSRRHTSKNGN